jgi:hypothetical protein
MRNPPWWTWPLALLLTSAALAQSSESFDLEEQVLNAGGAPAGGAVPGSAGFRVTLASIGEPLAGTGAASGSFAIDSSFAGAYLPPGEASGLVFPNAQTLEWAPERSTGDYNLYRGSLGEFPGFGTCLRQGIPGETVTDDDPVPSGGGFFYLVTASNRLGEEGTKGFQGDGTERAGNVCP